MRRFLVYLPFALAVVFGAMIGWHRFHHFPTSSALNDAISRCDEDAVKRLLEHGASANERIQDKASGRNNWTPLWMATWRCAESRFRNDDTRVKASERIIDLLLKHRAQMNFQSKNRSDHQLFRSEEHTCLAVAVSEGDLSLYRFLLERGAHPKVACSEGPTLLFTTSLFTNHLSEVVDELLKAGVDIDRKDHLGRTALHHAVEKDRKEQVEILLVHGANANIRDTLGLTPLDFARSGKCKDVLLAAGAKPGDVKVSSR